MKLYVRIILFILIPIVLLPVAVAKTTPAFLCLYMLMLMAGFWALDILPYGITSLIPVLFAPLMGIETSQVISGFYSNDSLMLCLGRLIMACAFQKQQIHRRFGLFLLTKFGPQPRMIMLSCMIPSYILTMFISNTATAPIMLEFALELIEDMRKIEKGIDLDTTQDKQCTRYGTIGSHNSIRKSSQFNQLSTLGDEYASMTNAIESNQIPPVKIVENKNLDQLLLALSLGTGYAASNGAIATLVACGPNLILYGILAKNGYGQALNYGTFLSVGLPTSVITFIFTWVWIGIVNLGPKRFFAIRKNTENEDIFFRRVEIEKHQLGPISFNECSCIFLTGLVIVLWITRSITDKIGWGYYFPFHLQPDSQSVSDATPMILIIILLYMWPTKLKFWDTREVEPMNERLLSWDFTNKNLPWAIIFLLGTGFAITHVCEQSHFSDEVSNYLTFLQPVGVAGVVIICSIISCFTTELLSSTTILPVYISIFLKLACRMKIHPFYFAFPLTLSSSFAFCLPAATTPNIAIYNRGLATTKQMIKSGILMDLFCIFIVFGSTYCLVYPIFRMSSPPPWFQNCTK